MILEETTRIEYDFSMCFAMEGVFKCGAQVPSGTTDHDGKCHTFDGFGIVVATRSDWKHRTDPTPHTPETIYVKTYPKIEV